MFRRDGKTWQDDNQEALTEHFRAMRQREAEWHEKQKERERREKARQYFPEGSEQWLAVEEMLHRPLTGEENPDDWNAFNDWVVNRVWLEGDQETCRFCGRDTVKVEAVSLKHNEYHSEHETKEYRLTLCIHCG